MRILELKVEGYRSLKQIHWKPGDLNVLIGPNGSGKTNLVRLLTLISISARGGLGKHVLSAGGIAPLLWDKDGDHIAIELESTPVDSFRDPETERLTYQIDLLRIGKATHYRIEQELLGNFNRYRKGLANSPFKFIERDGVRAVIFDEDQRTLKRLESVPEQETVLSLSGGPFVENRIIVEFQSELASWAVYEALDTRPDASVREAAVTRYEEVLNPDGQDFIPFLHTRYTRDQEFRQEIDSAMRSAFGENFERLDFTPAAEQRIELGVQWKGLRHLQTAADLSDGTLKFMYLLAVLANPSPPPLVVIEEPESNLHPAMLPILAEYAAAAADC